MSMKKLTLLVTSGLMFLLVMTTVVKTISKSLYLKGEKTIASIKRANTSNEALANMVNTYNYVEVKEEKEEVKEPVVEENKVDQSVQQTTDNTNAEAQAVYTGKLTGYGGDCPGCSGYLACRTREGSSFNLKTDGYYYNDSTYGNVRILAAATSGFPCGTIIQVNNGIMSEFTAVVLDTGGSMNSSWSRGEVWMDLAFSTSSDPALGSSNSSNTTFKVLRQGW